jgi:flagellar L-ring protein precursor FlgH
MSRCEPTLAALLAVGFALASAGCVEHALIESVRPSEHPTVVPSPAPPVSEGGIWRGGTASGSFLYYDRKARGVGDLVTVVLAETLTASGSANTTLAKESTLGANLTSDIGFTDLLQDAAETIFGWIGVEPSGATIPAGAAVNVVDANQGSEFTGDGETARDASMRGVVTCQVIAVLPNGVYHVYGRRKILVNHELQMITVDGLVRRSDIGIDNSVLSTQLADVKLTFDGIGVIDDKQRPPLLARVFDWIYPF